MRNQKKIIEVIEGLDFRQHTSNPKLWFKPVGPDAKYGVDMSGIKPVAFKFDGTDHITDESEPVIKFTMDAINAALKPKQKEEPAENKPKPEEDPKEESTEEMFECELCGDNRPISERTPVGVPETHGVCAKCTEKITSGKIKVPEWFQKQESIAVDAIPDEPQPETEQPITNDTLTVPTEAQEPQPVTQNVDDFIKVQSKANEIPKSTNPDPEPETNEIIADEHKPKLPIKRERVSSRICDIVPELAERGKIKIGGKGEERTGQGGKTYRLPTKSDHFTIVTTAKNDKGDFIVDNQIMDTIGDCTELDIMVLYNDPDLIFRTSYAYFDSAKCQCRGDGRIAQLANGKFIECNPETCETFQAKGCKPQGVLSVILMDAPRVGGVYKLRTTSWNTIRNITTSLDTIKSLTFGQLAGLPLVLTLKPKTVTIPGTRKTTVIFMANIEFKGSMTELLTTATNIANANANAMDEIKRIEENARLMLNEAPSAEECKDITEEFYPDTVMKEMEIES
jgi:hypothetical protein